MAPIALRAADETQGEDRGPKQLMDASIPDAEELKIALGTKALSPQRKCAVAGALQESATILECRLASWGH